MNLGILRLILPQGHLSFGPGPWHLRFRSALELGALSVTPGSPMHSHRLETMSRGLAKPRTERLYHRIHEAVTPLESQYLTRSGLPVFFVGLRCLGILLGSWGNGDTSSPAWPGQVACFRPSSAPRSRVLADLGSDWAFYRIE